MHISQCGLFKKIDFRNLDLPSSQLTIKYLRDRFPGKAEHVVSQEGERLDAMWDAERLFILIGYASEMGKEAEAEVHKYIPQEDGRSAAVQDLICDLIYFGLADGPVTAKQIVNGLQDIGAGMARGQVIGKIGR